ncbi:hypothetical protein HK101_005129 [Irineochytrium annulatum]|nr:hypothetical protein HK101_005129 [Irineochytrium annulatum]
MTHPPTQQAPAPKPGSLASLVAKVPWQPIFQRLPGVWLIAVILFGLFGPAHVPYIFGAYFILLHVFLVGANLRSAWGVNHVRWAAKQTSYTDWLDLYCEKTGALDGFDLRHDLPYCSVVHVIVIPNYKENLETMCETLDILASHPRASTNYKICLAMEESEAGAEDKAITLIRLYADHFHDIVFTIHPCGREGEVRGKGSNVSWATQQMARLSKDKRSEIFTIMDADTAFAADYFNAVTYHFAVSSAEERRLCMFAPCTVFDRNAKDVPTIVRLTDTMWSIGVMSNLYPSSLVAFPCSAYSISMELAASVGFWDVGPEALGEDMHMYLKCFFATEGRVRMRPIYSPASCCNIEGEGFFGGMRARYSQAKRHLWGCLDTGFALRRAITGILAPGLAGPLVRTRDPKGKKKGDENAASIQFSITLILALFHRLTEAHIVVGHLFLLMFMGSMLIPTGPTPSSLAVSYWESVTNDGVHPFIIWAIEFCGWLRFSTIFPLLMTIVNYEMYHQWVGVERWRLSGLGAKQPPLPSLKKEESILDIESGQLMSVEPAGRYVQPLGRRSQLSSPRTKWNLLDWTCLPLCGLFFQAIPQVHAQITQLWTDRLDYVVAMKPALASVNPGLAAALAGKDGRIPEEGTDGSVGVEEDVAGWEESRMLAREEEAADVNAELYENLRARRADLDANTVSPHRNNHTHHHHMQNHHHHRHHRRRSSSPIPNYAEITTIAPSSPQMAPSSPAARPRRIASITVTATQMMASRPPAGPHQPAMLVVPGDGSVGAPSPQLLAGGLSGSSSSSSSSADDAESTATLSSRGDSGFFDSEDQPIRGDGGVGAAAQAAMKRGWAGVPAGSGAREGSTLR